MMYRIITTTFVFLSLVGCMTNYTYVPMEGSSVAMPMEQAKAQCKREAEDKFPRVFHKSKRVEPSPTTYSSNTNCTAYSRYNIQCQGTIRPNSNAIVDRMRQASEDQRNAFSNVGEAWRRNSSINSAIDDCMAAKGFSKKSSTKY